MNIKPTWTWFLDPDNNILIQKRQADNFLSYKKIGASAQQPRFSNTARAHSLSEQDWQRLCPTTVTQKHQQLFSQGSKQIQPLSFQSFTLVQIGSSNYKE